MPPAGTTIRIRPGAGEEPAGMGRSVVDVSRHAGTGAVNSLNITERLDDKGLTRV
jgi:hypothetical protein